MEEKEEGYFSEHEEPRSERRHVRFILPRGEAETYAYLYVGTFNNKLSKEQREENAFMLIMKSFSRAKAIVAGKEEMGDTDPEEVERLLALDKEKIHLVKLRKYLHEYLNSYERMLPKDSEFREVCRPIIDFKPIGIFVELDRIEREEYVAIKACIREEYTLLEAKLLDAAISFNKTQPGIASSIWPFMVEVEKLSPHELRRLMSGGFGVL